MRPVPSGAGLLLFINGTGCLAKISLTTDYTDFTDLWSQKYAEIFLNTDYTDLWSRSARALLAYYRRDARKHPKSLGNSFAFCTFAASWRKEYWSTLITVFSSKNALASYVCHCAPSLMGKRAKGIIFAGECPYRVSAVWIPFKCLSLPFPSLRQPFLSSSAVTKK